MTTATAASLRDILLDALEDAYDYRKATIQGCVSCYRNPAGICVEHRADNDAAYEYDEARKQIERSPGSPEVVAALAGRDGAS